MASVLSDHGAWTLSRHGRTYIRWLVQLHLAKSSFIAANSCCLLRVGYNHSYPTRTNGRIVLLNSSLIINQLDISFWCKRSDGVRRRENLWNGAHLLCWMKHTRKSSERVFFRRFSSNNRLQSRRYISGKLWRQLKFTGSKGIAFLEIISLVQVERNIYRFTLYLSTAPRLSSSRLLPYSY